MRVANWHDELVAVLLRWRPRERVFGQTDCCQFVGDVVLAMTGTDYRDRFPIYATEEEAAQILAAHGGMVGLLSSVWGPPKPAREATIGDVVSTDSPEGGGAGIHLGDCYASMTARGFAVLNTRGCNAAWSI